MSLADLLTCIVVEKNDLISSNPVSEDVSEMKYTYKQTIG